MREVKSSLVVSVYNLQFTIYNVHECIKFGWLMRGLVVFGFHLIGETVFLLKSLYQLGFVRFFGFYFWIGGTQQNLHKRKVMI
ncbi:hypothetical protein BSPWISOXPB_5516 [uncultured Gammaproteobacteria bacterium]|nr:hypothetical protein BSPWISOXPB_5516 [uncultured Gammaproteobacteria bacterium]